MPFALVVLGHVVVFLVTAAVVDADVAEGRVEDADDVDRVAAEVDRDVDGYLDDVAGQDAGGADGSAFGGGVRGRQTGAAA